MRQKSEGKFMELPDMYTVLLTQPFEKYPEFPASVSNFNRLSESERKASESVKKDIDSQAKDFYDRLFSAITKNISEMQRCYEYLADNPDLDETKKVRIRNRIREYVLNIEPKLNGSRFLGAISYYVYIREKYKDPTTTWKMQEHQRFAMI